MSGKIVDIEAETLEEARAQVQSQTPEGLRVLSEQVISDGTPKTVKVHADTTESAIAKALSQIPTNATILLKKELSAPEQRDLTIQAFGQSGAEAEARRRFGGATVIKSLRLTVAGKKGFLGIGKTPHLYKAEVFQQAVVEITYKCRAKVLATIGEKKIVARDNVGTRLDSFDKARSYWANWMQSGKVPPFVDYKFKTASECMKAITSLSFITKASDTGELISTDPIYYGYYEIDPGEYEVLICGEALTYEMFHEAVQKLTEAGGILKDKKEPTKKEARSIGTRPSVSSSSVSFLRKEHKGQYTYHVYRGPDKEAAIAFLKTLQPQTTHNVYHIVETPEGNWGKDIDGIYEES